MLKNKYITPNLQLKITDNILSIPSLPLELNKETYEWNQIPLLNLILGNPYELITFSMIRQLLKKKDNIKNNITLINNNIVIDKYVLSPFTTYKSYGILLESTYFFYHSIEFFKKIEKNKKILIFKLLVNNIIDDFSLEKYLIQYKNYSIDDIKTIFIVFDNNQYTYDVEFNYKIMYYKNIDIDELEKYMGMNDYIYINTVRLINTVQYKNCYYDIINLPYMLFLYNISLKHLKIDGDLFIYKLYPMLSYSYIGLFFYIFTLFDSIELYNNYISNHHIGLFHLKKYNGNSKLNKIFNAYYKIDSNIGLNNYIKNYDDYKIDYCTTTNDSISNSNNKMIQSITTEIHPDFIQYIYNIYVKFNQQLSIYNSQCNAIKLKNIHSILSYNIQVCKDFCNKYNIEIEEYYKNFKPLTYKKVIKTYFINKKNINYNNIKMNTDSIFSITLPDDSIRMAKYIQNIFPTITTVIDGTSNVGTNTIVMADYFEKIIGCEIDKITFEYLKHNIKEYKLKNVKFHNGSIIPFMKDNKFDVLTTCLYLDPPWTGVHYKLENLINLYLDDMNVIDFIKEINIKYICLKVPFNYNFKYTFRKFSDIQIYQLSSFYFIMLTK